MLTIHFTIFRFSARPISPNHAAARTPPPARHGKPLARRRIDQQSTRPPTAPPARPDQTADRRPTAPRSRPDQNTPKTRPTAAAHVARRPDRRTTPRRRPPRQAAARPLPPNHEPPPHDHTTPTARRCPPTDRRPPPPRRTDDRPPTARPPSDRLPADRPKNPHRRTPAARPHDAAISFFTAAENRALTLGFVFLVPAVTGGSGGSSGRDATKGGNI